MEIAVLALQGAFIEHGRALSRLGVSSFEVRNRRDAERHFDGLILPGGESTAQRKLLKELNLREPLKRRIDAGLPVFGTCAGLLLLAKEICNDDSYCFDAMDIVAVRNAYGRQLGSFYTEGEFEGIGTVPMTFIRAPYIAEVRRSVKPLSVVDGRIVAARKKIFL